MTFAELCQAFDKPNWGLKGIKSKTGIVKFFLDETIGPSRIFESSYYGKWFRGDETINFWNDICDSYDSNKFIYSLRNSISPSARYELAKRLEIVLESDEEPDLLNLAKAIAEQFYLIALNKGSFDGNVINEKYQEFKTPSEWGGYVSRAKDNEKICKSLFYRTQGVELDSFYVWNRISLVQPMNLGFDVPDEVENKKQETDEKDDAAEEKKESNILVAPKPEVLFQKKNHVLLIGMEGIGKSLMVRKMFLEALDDYHNTGVLPFFIYLREYNKEHRDLLTLIKESINIYDENFTRDEAHSLLLQGNGIVYMDGLDEIAPDQFSEFHRELDRFTKAYKKSRFLITTRNYTLLSASDFKFMWLLPFTAEQSKSLISKLSINTDVKQQVEELIDKQRDSYKEYLSIPMLLTLLAMNFDKFDTIPSKRHELYEVAYETLLEIHDRDEKDDYEKRFYSVKGSDEFTPIFSEFCARTCRDGEVTFTNQQIANWLKKVTAINDVADPTKFSTRGFTDDVCYKACLMYEREREYTFLHRSFQEYLFASFYAYADDERLIKLGQYLSNPQKCVFHNEDAFEMLYDMAPKRVEQFLFLPYLKQIFESYDNRVMFWRYLQLGYGKIRIRFLEKEKINSYGGSGNVIENARVNEPYNFLFYMITKKMSVMQGFSKCVYEPDSDIEKIYEDLIIGTEVKGNIDLKNVSERLLKDQLNLYEENSISDGSGSVVFGHDCLYDPELAIKEPSKYKMLQELIYVKDSELWEAFDRIRDLYDDLLLAVETNSEDDF